MQTRTIRSRYELYLEPVKKYQCVCKPCLSFPNNRHVSKGSVEAECVGELTEWLDCYDDTRNLAGAALTFSPATPNAFDILDHEMMFAMRTTNSIPLSFEIPDNDRSIFVNVMLAGLTGQSISLSEFIKTYFRYHRLPDTPDGRNFLLQFKSLSPMNNASFIMAGLLLERLFDNTSFRYICSYCGKSMKVIMGDNVLGSSNKCCQLLSNIREIVLVLLMITGTYISKNPSFQVEKVFLMKNFFHRRLSRDYFEKMEWIILSQLKQRVIITEYDYKNYISRKVVQLTLSRNYYCRTCPFCHGICSDVIFNRVPSFI